MRKLSFRFFLVVFLLYLETEAEAQAKSIEINFNRELKLSSEFHIKWSNLDPTWVTIEMSGPDFGYVALGFSGNGAMFGSDIVMGWIDHQGKPHVKDLHGVGNVMPVEDVESNYEVLGGEKEDGQIVIRFRRKWDTCDDQDFLLAGDTVRLIWAYGTETPKILENGTFIALYHGENRGGRSVFMRTPPIELPQKRNGRFLDPRIKSWDAHVSNNSVNGETTIYFCKLFKFPALEKKHQIIGFKPILDKGAKKYVHHIALFECSVPPSAGTLEEVLAEHLGQESGNKCFPSMPPVWDQHCQNMLWSLGKEGDMIPEPSGFPIGEEHGGVTYFQVQIHYDNPLRKKFSYSAGARIFYTDKLREFDGGTFTMGHRVSHFHLIPPQMKSFRTLAFCSSECTEQSIPEDGVTITHALLHAHKMARKVKLRHIRNGIELPPVAQDKYFDINYEQSRALKPDRKFFPGDEFILLCDYNSMDRQNLTFAGPSLDDEMCLAIVYHYPKSKLVDCKVQPEFHHFLQSVGINEVEGPGLERMSVPYDPLRGNGKHIPLDDIFAPRGLTSPPNAFDEVTIMSPHRLRGMLLGNYIRSYDWGKTRRGDGEKFEWKWGKGPMYMFCASAGKERIQLKNYISFIPNITKEFEEESDEECRRKEWLQPSSKQRFLIRRPD